MAIRIVWASSSQVAEFLVVFRSFRAWRLKATHTLPKADLIGSLFR